MKKLVFSMIMVLGLAFASNAQEISKNALGLRLGDNNGFGGEISYQRALGGNNRLEVDLGWRNSNNADALKATGLYQWVWNIDGGFNWYAGVGGGLTSWSYKYKDDSKESGIGAFAAGDIGIEYLFDIPLQLSLDFRPELYFGSDKWRKDSFGPDIALSVRYRF